MYWLRRLLVLAVEDCLASLLLLLLFAGCLNRSMFGELFVGVIVVVGESSSFIIVRIESDESRQSTYKQI